MDTRYATVHKAAVQSTQDEARRAFLADRRPVLVTASRQTRGRGRRGAEWFEAPRAMYSSLAVAPGWPVEAWPRLSPAAGLAVAEAIEAHLDVNVSLKWPNDILFRDDKVGGILIEAEDDGVVIGCGLNLWWPDAPAGFAALLDDDPGDDLAGTLAAGWVERVLDVLDGSPDGWGVDRYRAQSAIIGRAVTWEPDGTGVALDVDVEGYLLVDTDGTVKRLGAGRVNLVRRATVAPDQAAKEEDT